MKLKKNNGFLYNATVVICFPVFKLLYRFDVEGEENIPFDGKCIVCPNHTSNADPAILVLSKGRKFFFMAKEELFKNKILSFLFNYFGAFPVARGKSDKSAIDKSNKVLESGEVLAIFIEGTRSKSGELLKPKSGAAMIAFNTNTSIVPVCISPEGGGRVKFFKKVHVKIGKPMCPEKLGMKNGTLKEFREASRMVMDEIKTMKGEK